MSALPTREEIAEIVSAGVRLHTPRGGYYALEIADDLLARLRPAWEALSEDYSRACQTVANMHAAAIGRIEGPHRGIVEDVEDLRADLRACAEALENLTGAGEHLAEEHCVAEDDPQARSHLALFNILLDNARAALARPGVQEALK